MQDQTCTRWNMHNSPSILDLSRVRSHKLSIAAMCNAHSKLSNVFERFCIPQRAFAASWRIRYWLLQKKHIQRKTSSPSTPDFRTQPFTALTKSFSRYSSSTRIQNVSLYLKLKVPNQNQRSRETSAILSTPRSYTMLTYNYNIMQLDHHSCLIGNHRRAKWSATKSPVHVSFNASTMLQWGFPSRGQVFWKPKPCRFLEFNGF